MPYTNPWNVLLPPGSQAAITADDELRKLKVDIGDRLTGVLVGPMTDDPLVVKPQILGNVNGKKYSLHHSAFKPDVEWDSFSTQPTFTRTALYAEHATTDANTRTMWAPLHIPPGATIQTISFLVNRNGGVNMNLSLLRNDFTLTPAANVVAITATAANGISIPALAPAHLVIASDMYALSVTFPASQAARLYGAVVFYDTPDCRITV